jgi:hypothetical protein
MSERAAVALLVVAALIGAGTAFLVRPRVPRPVTIAVLAAVGVAAGIGALALEDGPVPGIDRALTLVLLAVMTPVHVLVVFGRPRAGAAR